MALKEIIAECEKLETAHKSALLNKLNVALSILKNIPGAEHLVSEPEKAPEAPKKPEAVAAKPKGPLKPREADPMPVGG